MSGRYTLNCDLCEARPGDRAEFDAHMRDVHGTTSLKPQVIVRQANAILASMPGMTPERLQEIKSKSVAELRREIDEADRRARERADREDAEERRRAEIKTAMRNEDERVTRNRLVPGLLTFRSPAGAFKGCASTPIDSGFVSAKFHYHGDGSWLQFASERDRGEYVTFLTDYLRDARDLGDMEEDCAIAAQFIQLAKNAKPWSRDSDAGRYRG